MLAAPGARVARIAVAAAALASMSGCSTLMRGVTQDVQIATDPIGAACELRAKDGVTVVDALPWTPGYVRMRKGLDGYVLTCSAKGYLDTRTPIDSGVENDSVGSATLGAFSGLHSAAGATLTSTVLSSVFPAATAAAAATWLGVVGIVAFAVDVATGSIFEFPPEIALTLVPSSFPDAIARDAFFDGEEKRLRERHALKRRELVESCKVACVGAINAMDEGLMRQMAELERLRSSATLRG